MPGYCEQIALALGGTCEDQRHGVEVVLSRIGQLDFQIFSAGPNLQLIRASGFFSPRWQAAEDIRALSQTEVVLKAWHLQAEHLQFQQSNYQLLIGLPRQQERLPPPEILADWLRALAELAGPHLYDTNDHCEDCGQPPSRQMFRRQLQGRYCDECQAERQSLQVALQQTAAPETGETNLCLPDQMNFPCDTFAEHFCNNPRRYRLGLLGWVVLGQAALLGSAGVALAALVVLGGGLWAFMVHGSVGLGIVLAKALALVGAKLVAVLVAALGAVTASLSAAFRLPTRRLPEGTLVKRGQSTAFFDWADDLARQLHSPKIDAVILVSEMTAAVTEQRGWLGYRRYLILGIPVLETFARAELASIVGHELAHLRHGDLASLWIYRTAGSWLELGGRLQHEQGFNLFGAFASWYVPRFLARAQVVCRAQELAADRHASSLTDGAYSLLKFQVVARLRAELVEEAMHKVLRQGRGKEFDCIQDVMPLMGQVPSEHVQELIEDAFVEPSAWYDSHPSLARRLENLGVSPLETRGFELKIEGCGGELFDDYTGLRTQAMNFINRRMRLYLRVSGLTMRGREQSLARLTPGLEEHPLADERRLDLALCARDLCMPDLEEEHWKRLLESSIDAVKEVARTSLIAKLVKEDRASEALPLLKEEDLANRLLVHRRLRHWQECDDICRQMEASAEPPQPREQLEARRAIYQLMQIHAKEDGRP